MQLAALHHVTCVCSDAQRTLDFYRDELGFVLVKKTVNFDDPHSYHLYFGDRIGWPGSLMTFFEWPRAERGRLGRGTLESIGLVTPDPYLDEAALDLWLRTAPVAAAYWEEVGAIEWELIKGFPDYHHGAPGARAHT